MTCSRAHWRTMALICVLSAVGWAVGCSASHEGDDGGGDLFDGSLLSDGGADAGRDAGPRDAGPPFDGGPHCRDIPADPPTGSGCEASLCGDGVRDPCTICTPCFPGGPGDPPGGPPIGDAGMCCTTTQEVCDGADLGTATCESLGYAGGILRCGDWCGLDTSGCDVCETSARIDACVRADVDPAQPGALAIATGIDAAGAEVIAVAWATHTLGGRGALHFARFGSDLSLIEETPCLATEAREVALARVPSGWLVAAGTPGGITLVPLDADGGSRGSTRTIAGGRVPILAERDGGGPLLLYAEATGSSEHAALLDESGVAAWDVVAFTDVVESEYGDAVFVGDGFLATERTFGGAGVRRVELDGSLGAASAFAGSSTEYPQLTWMGSAGQLVWADFSASPRLFTARLDRTGAATGARALLSPDDFNPTPMATVGGDPVVFLPGYTGWTGHGNRIAFTRVDPSGAPRYAPVLVATEPELFFEPRIAPLADGAVLGWLSAGYPGGIRLARISP